MPTVTVAGVPMKLDDLPPDVRAAVEAELGTTPVSTPPARRPPQAVPPPRPAQHPISREQFRSLAKPLEGRAGDFRTLLQPKEFATGGLGWHGQGRHVLDLGGQKVSVQVNVLVTILKLKG